MITQTESGLATGDYSDVQATRTGASYALTLQKYSLAFSLLSGSSEIDEFDADTSATHIIRAVLSGTTITVERAGTDGSFATVDTISGLSSPVYPSVYFGNNATGRVFYNNGTALVYRESTDNGATWGSFVSVATVSNIAWIAAVSTTEVHYATDDGYNTRLHVAKYSGSWSTTDSEIYYPGSFLAFDAETINGVNVIAFIARGQVRYDTNRQGAWYLRQQGSTWADPYELDVVDEYVAYTTSRRHTMLSYIDSKLFCTYVAVDDAHEASCFSRSASGEFWQFRQPVGTIAEKGKMLTLGNYTFWCNGENLYRSASTGIVGNPTTTVDISDRVSRYQGDRERAYQSQLVVDDDDSGATDLTGFDRWQLVEQIGYQSPVDGDDMLVQVALTELDSLQIHQGLPVREQVLTMRDYMARMTDRTEADHYREWTSQLRHYDDFENALTDADDKKVLNSGMKHTATMSGYWSTEDNTLKLRSNNTEGLAFCTVDKFLGHTIVQEAIKVPTAGNSEWAGVVFRALDEDNLWLARYSQADDKIQIMQKVEGVWQSAAAESATLSWSVATWYYVRVEARLSLFRVYYSTDGVTWTLACSYTDQTMTSTQGAYQEGYVGHAGYGYSDEDTEPWEPDPWVPPSPIERNSTAVPFLYDQLIVGSNGGGVAYCDMSTAAAAGSPTWTAANGGLTVSGSKVIEALIISQEQSKIYAATHCGLWSASLPLSGGTTWSYDITAAEILAATSQPGSVYLHDFCIDWEDSLKQWCIFTVYKYTPSHCWCMYTTDGWASWSLSTEFPYATVPWSVDKGGGIDLARNTANTMWAGHSYNNYAGAIFKSTNLGSSWTANTSGLGWHNKKVVVPDGDGDDLDIFVTDHDGQGVWVSANGGSSFTKKGLASRPQYIHAKRASQSVYVAELNGVSTYNYGTATFSMFRNLSTYFPCYDVIATEWSGDTLVAGVAVGGNTAANAYHFTASSQTNLNSSGLSTAVSNFFINCVAHEGGNAIE